MNTILFGNGLNLLNGTTSWDKLVHGIDDSSDDASIPNTLQYEAKIMRLPYKRYENFSKNSELSNTGDGSFCLRSDEDVRYNMETIKGGIF